MELPKEYLGLTVDQKQQYVQTLQSDVSELQATLDELRSSAPTNLISKRGHQVVPYPPIVKFKTKKSPRSTLRHKVVGMTSFKQPGGYTSLATVAQNGTAILWDAQTGLKYESFHIGKGSTMALGGNTNGAVLAAGGLGCFIEIYSIGSSLRNLTGGEADVEFATSQFDAGKKSISGRAPQYRYSLSGHDAAVSSVVFLDTTCCVSGAHDSSIFVWDITTASSISSVREQAPVTSLDTTKGYLFASTAQDGSLKVWDVRDRAGQAQRMTSTMPLTGVKFMPEGNSVLASLRNGLQLFDMRCNSILENYMFKGGAITSLDVSSSGRLGVVGTDTGSIVPVDLFQNRWFPGIDKRKDTISGIVIDEGTVYSSSWDGSVRAYYYNQ